MSSLKVDCGDPSPQVDFYALRAEAYIQLCDFSSAAQNLRRAYSFQPENTKYLERLAFVLYLQVPGAARHARRPPHTWACWLSLQLPGLSSLLGLVLTPRGPPRPCVSVATCCPFHDLSHLPSWFTARAG